MSVNVNAQGLTTIRQWLEAGENLFTEHQVFFGHGTDNAWDDAWALVAFATGLPINADASLLEQALTQEQKDQLVVLFSRRVEEKLPAPYLTQKAYYAGLEFYVDERVLVPRSPIAELVLNRLKPWYLNNNPSRILDLCCGSGCIGIVAAKEFTDADVTLADISQDALAVAEKNIEKHGVASRVKTCQSDLMADVEGVFDIILANPPYVDEEDMRDRPAEFVHEPDMALESGRWGLDHPLQILQVAKDYLAEDGVLVLEVGNSGEHLETLFPEVDFNWVDFEYGGHGVLVMSYTELEMYQEQFNNPDFSLLVSDF